MDGKKGILEAALFVSEEPLDNQDVADLMNIGSKGFVQTLIESYKKDLEDDKRGLELIETKNGYILQVKEEYIDDIKEYAPHQDISEAKLRTLSIIAYNAPVKQSKIIDIRGNRAYSQIKELEERGLIISSKEGRTKVLDVTDEFFDYFELDSMDDFKGDVGISEEEFLNYFDEEQEDEE